MRDQLRARRHLDRLGEGVTALPVEVVPRQAEQQLLLTVRRLQPQVAGIGAVVGVREGRVEQRVLRELDIGHLAVARRVRLDLDRAVDDDHVAHDGLRHVLAEVDADLGVIDRLLAVGRVVHLVAHRPAGRQVGAHLAVEDVGLGANRIAADRPAPAGLGGLAVGRHVLHPAGQHVVYGLAVAGLHRRGADPVALGLRVQGVRPLIVDHARGRHLVGRDLQDQVRLAQRPLGRHALHAGQRIGAFAARRACFHPVHERLDLFRAQVLGVGEMAHARVGVVGRHPVGADHLADHRREALDHLVAGQLHRPDAAGRVAGHAALLEDRGDVLHIGQLGLGAVREGDRRPVARRARRRRAAGHQGVQGRTHTARRAVVDDLPGLRIDDDRLGRAADAQRLADQLV